VRVGLVCPYSWDIPGGVQAHVRDLAEALLRLGHEVSVLAPADDETPLPPYVVGAGRAVPVRYNGSVARLQFGPVSAARVRRWLRDGRFDVLHVHEPVAPSLSLLACILARGPIVATFHTATARSRSLSAAQGVLQPFLEKIRGRIAVSSAARQVQVEHLGGDAVEIPNGVAVARYAGAAPLPGYPRAGGTVGFIGRYDEPRKGMAVLLAGLAALAPRRPDLRLLVAGRGDADDLRADLPPSLAGRVELLGQVSEADKARMLRSVDVYCAPNLGGESFGIILLEAMAAGTAILASDLDAFRRVLDDGRAGTLFQTGDAEALARHLGELLDDPQRRSALAAAGTEVVAAYDWPVVARQVVDVYETVIAADPIVVRPDPAPAAVPPDLVAE
jgi:phosphatidylinositol alpha-mannosyltransferase